ncbi:uncharacterized protein LOC113213922 [Frankliniella occidentalis]|uniref:Uncharacterized protein LOC113213922 n=1 Tax=Frankliniella occidentalis TaxID=133901 RepID=A0A9C6U4Z2_FRAOC|nr:uncharacterized protein LOC113213922 [Frankliniella occidentalis]
MQRSKTGDTGTPPQEQLQLAVQLEDSLRLLTTNNCSVVSEEEDGSTWKADVQLDSFGDVFRLLLLQLRADCQLAKALPANPRDLPDNIPLLRLIQDRVVPPRQQLQRGVDAGRKVVEALRLAFPKAVKALNRQLDESVAQLVQLEEALEQQVPQCKTGDGCTSPEQLQLAMQLEDSLRLLTTNKCSVVSEEEGGSTWRADVQLDGLGDVFRLLLLQLLADGQLVKVEDVAVSSSPAAYVGPPMTTTLTITDKDLAEDDLKVNDIVRDKQRWEHIRCIKGLKGKGSDKLLRVLASHPVHLEELGCSSPVEPKVMEEVLKLTSLKRIDVECVEKCDDYPDLPLQLEELRIETPSERQLRCVQRMPALHSLTVWDYFGPNVTFTPSQSGTLRWLCVALNTLHKPTMLSLVRAHASSLRELQVYCTVSDDEQNGGFYFPDLGRDLAASGLLHLKRLVLMRPNAKCTDAAGCLMQRRNLRSVLPSSVGVVCGPCAASALE